MRYFKILLFLFLVGVFLLSPEVILADSSKDFGAAEMNARAADIKKFLFGPAMRLAGILGGAYGMLQAVLTSSIRPLILYGGIGLSIGLMETFIDAVFK